MLYRKNPKNGKELSILGYGCLRFTKKRRRDRPEKGRGRDEGCH